MRISVISAEEIDAGTHHAWLQLQQSSPQLSSPYFTPEFTQAVSAVRDDVRIAVLEDGRGVRGFFPHQRRRSMGSPVGGRLSDHHGVVCAPGTSIDWSQLLHSCELAFWRFDHLPKGQAPAGHKLAHACSPGLDLSAGFSAWRQRRLDGGGRRIAELDRKARKMAREVGPLRFEAQVRDRAVFDAVLRLKSEQCRRTGVSDFFSQPWTRALVERIWQTELPHFAGRLSALWAGDTLVAAHLGMRSRQCWHWWFPVYEPAQARHSPGAQLLLRVAQAAADEGCTLLDLGKGDDAYKPSFADCAMPLVEGWVTRPALTTALVGAHASARQWLRSSPLLQALRPVVRSLRRGGMRATG
ncbi:GNAT family N-acetyltransferase [Ramlibacter sp. AN1015]|uniref:GNAT family N-acetyltransferase n=1 Tax=Ramlibacter sp. AN1015 TaxID=3133428 RepID=UPI0030C48ECF